MGRSASVVNSSRHRQAVGTWELLSYINKANLENELLACIVRFFTSLFMAADEKLDKNWHKDGALLAPSTAGVGAPRASGVLSFEIHHHRRMPPVNLGTTF